jgi:predicted  nucleic acid-binding Zn-ribbon protein
MNWTEELHRLEAVKENEQAAARLAFVADEITELVELENEFTITGTELDQYKQSLAEVTARNSPEIEELTKTLTELKSAINEIDVEMYLQGVVINNSSLEVARQQNLCSTLAANKDNGDLEFAAYMAGQQTLIELQRKLETEKAKLKTLTERFYKLNAVPDIATLDRRIRELKAEALNVQNRVANVELDRRAMNTRMMFLRATIAKNEANNSSTSR